MAGEGTGEYGGQGAREHGGQGTVPSSAEEGWLCARINVAKQPWSRTDGVV